MSECECGETLTCPACEPGPPRHWCSFCGGFVDDYVPGYDLSNLCPHERVRALNQNMALRDGCTVEIARLEMYGRGHSG